MRYFSIITAILFIVSCSQNNSKQYYAPEKKDTLKPPVTIAVKNPFIVHLDTCPPPLTIAMPERKKDSFVLKINNSKTVIHAPEIKPADFSVLMQNYNIEQGLSNSSVRSGCMDKSGNLWFATFGGGVSRYDGKAFKSYTATQGLINNLILSILVDKDSNLWIGSFGGVSNYNGRFFTNYTTTQGLVSNLVRCIFQDKTGNFWFGTDEGVSYYDGKSFTSYTTADGLENDLINSIFQDKAGNFWFGTGGGVSHYDGKAFRNYGTNEGLPNNYVSSILEDKNGNIWLGTGGGICRLDQYGSFKGFIAPLELTNNNILSIHEDKKGNLWFGTNEGVFRLKEDGSLMNVNTNRGLVNNNVNRILEDKTGNLWFCTEDGISRFDQDGKFFMSYTTTQGLANNSVWSFCEDKSGNLWFGTNGGGVCRLDRAGKTFTNYTTAQGLSNNEVKSIIEDKMGNLWFGTDGGGVCRLDEDRKVFRVYNTLQGLPGNGMRNIIEDKNGNLWFSTVEQGVFCLDQNKKNITTYTTEQGLSNNAVRSIIEDRAGNLWFGTVGSGISRLDKERKSFTNYAAAQGLANNFIWSTLEDKNGNLWIGTMIGISRYDGKSFTNYNSAYGLPDGDVRGIVMDKEGVIWLGTDKGFTAIKGFARDAEQPDSSSHEVDVKPSNEFSNAELKTKGLKPVFEIYNNKTGYQGKGINASSMGITQEGIIWAGTGGFLGDKLIRFNFSGIPKNLNPPEVFIQSLKINNEFISWYNLIPPNSHKNSNREEVRIDRISTLPGINEEGIVLGKILSEEQREIMQEKFRDVKFDSISRFYPLPVNLVLPYHHNNITFDFAAIEPSRPYLVRYQYMLEGYDKEWSPVSDQTTATFGNMHEGKYTFNLKAQGPDGVWSEPVIYTFKVLPPWYRTWWFIITEVGCLVTLFYLVIRWRLRQKFRLQLERSEKEKQVAEMKQKTAELQQQTTELEMQALRAQMNPHFIFNCLSSINRFILKNESETASDYLTKFSRLIRMVLNNTKQKLIILEDELEMLRLYLDLERLRFKNSFDYNISFRNHFDISSIFIPPLLLQPFAENAIWHGLMHKDGQGILEIAFELDNNVLNCYITDNGVGRKKAASLKSRSAEKQKSMGMQITAGRLALLNKDAEQTIFRVEDLVDAEGHAAGTRVTLKIRYKETIEEYS